MGETRNNLNLEEELQICKRIQGKLMKWTLMIGFIFDVILTVIILYSDFDSVDTQKIVIALLQIMIACGIFIMYYLFYRFLLGEAKHKLSNNLAKDCLSTTKWVQVIPVKADDYQEFILNELPKRAKFFAKLRADSDVIDVSIKFNNE